MGRLRSNTSRTVERISFKLAAPVIFDGVAIETLPYRRPKGRDMRRFMNGGDELVRLWTDPCELLEISPVRQSPRRESLDKQGNLLVLQERIELSTSPLPRECSTTELLQLCRKGGLTGEPAPHGANRQEITARVNCLPAPFNHP
jgi:hypothetical protein